MKNKTFTPEQKRNIWILRIVVFFAAMVQAYVIALCVWTTDYTFMSLWKEAVKDNGTIGAIVLYVLGFLLFPFVCFGITCIATDMSPDLPTWGDIFERYKKDYEGKYEVDIVLQKWLKDKYEVPQEIMDDSGSAAAGGIAAGMMIASGGL